MPKEGHWIGDAKLSCDMQTGFADIAVMIILLVWTRPVMGLCSCRDNEGKHQTEGKKNLFHGMSFVLFFREIHKG